MAASPLESICKYSNAHSFHIFQPIGIKIHGSESSFIQNTLIIRIALPFNTVVSSIKTALVPCIVQLKSHLEGFVLLSIEFEVSFGGAYLINIYSI